MSAKNTNISQQLPVAVAQARAALQVGRAQMKRLATEGGEPGRSSRALRPLNILQPRAIQAMIWQKTATPRR
eukprot:6195803-Pyramimonas_sp.AAC.1